VDGDDVEEAAPPPHHSKADPGGGAEPLGWPERTRRAVEAAAPRRVRDAVGRCTLCILLTHLLLV
jgi:hypothetical protein